MVKHKRGKETVGIRRRINVCFSCGKYLRLEEVCNLIFQVGHLLQNKVCDQPRSRKGDQAQADRKPVAV
jgi:hypothetical protein